MAADDSRRVWWIIVHELIFDGVKYVMAQDNPRVGIGITTLNRQACLDETLSAIEKFTPGDFPVVVVDDGSEVPAMVPSPLVTKLIRHAMSRGIPAAKNRCIEALMDLGVDHLFLFDDDTRPVCDDWWKPYVDSKEPHYQYNWTHFKMQGSKPVPKMSVLYGDSDLIGYAWSMGCVLYATADVVRRVGGMFPGFGMGMEEHCEWSQRIHNAGLTSFVHQDVPGSGELFYASDEHGDVKRSFDWKDRLKLLAHNEKLRMERFHLDRFVEYRTPRDVVLTSYFTSQPDPQRGGKHLPVDCVPIVGPLVDSLAGHNVGLVLLHDVDMPRPSGADVESCCVDTPLCAYRQRWLSQWQWLRDHPEIRYAWLVDATDVVMLNDPFPHMLPDTLYTGWETKPVGCEWIRNNSPKAIDWINENAQRMLLNCGVAGGDRATLMRLCQRMNDLWLEHDASPLHEMVFFNIAAREAELLVTGPQVTTVFKANKNTDPYAWWAHK